jgi:hypothetical protein
MQNNDIKGKLALVNERFKGKMTKIDKESIADILYTEIGRRKTLEKLKKVEIEKIVSDKGIVGVDGSINSYGGIYPHYVSIIQALAKSTKKNTDDILLQDIYVPMFEEHQAEMEDESRRRSRMSGLELKAASIAIESMEAKLFLMDGSLIHYSIDCPEEWKNFKQKALDNGKIIIGITEEVKTKDIVNAVKNIIDINDDMLYDREILFGVLEQGELLEFMYTETKKSESGIRTCYARLSEDPQVIGFDFLQEQYEEGMSYSNLIYTLTPPKGRGIPLWLDIVDKEVKVTDDMVKAYVESCMGRDIIETYLNPKRNKRW